MKCRETASVGQPNYSSPAAHSKPSEERGRKIEEQKKRNPENREEEKQGERPVTRNRRKAGEQTEEIPRNREASRRGEKKTTNKNREGGFFQTQNSNTGEYNKQLDREKKQRTTQEHTTEPKQSFGRSSITPPYPKSESKLGD